MFQESKALGFIISTARRSVVVFNFLLILVWLLTLTRICIVIAIFFGADLSLILSKYQERILLVTALFHLVFFALVGVLPCLVALVTCYSLLLTFSFLRPICRCSSKAHYIVSIRKWLYLIRYFSSTWPLLDTYQSLSLKRIFVLQNIILHLLQ